MTKSQNTKKALLASVISMLLCIAMLLGSTFAWFSDTVETGELNKIVAGNLDAELYYKKSDGTYEAVTASTNLFADTALWEPGHVEVINLKLKNAGTLAFFYNFGINVASCTDGKNVDGGDIHLPDHIKYAVVEEEKSYTSRENALTAAKANTPANLTTSKTSTGTLYPQGTANKETEKFVTLIVYMPTDIGNEANYRGDAIPEIKLGLKFTAVQTPFERDSFDDQYDKSDNLKTNMPEIVFPTVTVDPWESGGEEEIIVPGW